MSLRSSRRRSKAHSHPLPGFSGNLTGVDQNYRLELGANKQIYATQVDTAGQIRGAGLEAAKLRQAAAVIAGSKGSRCEQGRHPGSESMPKVSDAKQFQSDARRVSKRETGERTR